MANEKIVPLTVFWPREEVTTKRTTNDEAACVASFLFRHGQPLNSVAFLGTEYVILCLLVQLARESETLVATLGEESDGLEWPNTVILQAVKTLVEDERPILVRTERRLLELERPLTIALKGTQVCARTLLEVAWDYSHSGVPLSSCPIKCDGMLTGLLESVSPRLGWLIFVLAIMVGNFSSFLVNIFLNVPAVWMFTWFLVQLLPDG